VLTHDVGANRELLTRGAVVTPRFDQPAAVAELVRLVNDEPYRRRLSQEAREYALEEFTWSAVANKYLAVYRPPEGG
jgi:glycosyltransferase involved in cell wall biosynthesis